MKLKQAVKRAIKSLIGSSKREIKVPIPQQINTTELLNGKVALISGGSGGIGKAIAVSFLKNGAKVIITGSSEQRLFSAYSSILDEVGSDYSLNLQKALMDVSQIDIIPQRIIEIASEFDEDRIDILVNSAGVINETGFFKMSEAEYDKIMDINVKGTFFLCQAMGSYMIEKGIKGHILNVSSASALRPAWTPYQISKWAIRGFTLGLADTLLPHGIIVNAIAPGPVATKMLKKEHSLDIDNPKAISGRYAEPEEIANLATFMVSDMGNLIVGDTFYITGGSGVISSHM